MKQIHSQPASQCASDQRPQEQAAFPYPVSAGLGAPFILEKKQQADEVDGDKIKQRQFVTSYSGQNIFPFLDSIDVMVTFFRQIVVKYCTS